MGHNIVVDWADVQLCGEDGYNPTYRHWQCDGKSLWAIVGMVHTHVCICMHGCVWTGVCMVVAFLQVFGLFYAFTHADTHARTHNTRGLPMHTAHVDARLCCMCMFQGCSFGYTDPNYPYCRPKDEVVMMFLVASLVLFVLIFLACFFCGCCHRLRGS